MHTDVDALLQEFADVATTQGYVAHLSIMHATMKRFAASADRGALLADIPYRADRLIERLEADLQTMGSGLTNLVVPDPLVGDEYALGVAYALEGSALGAAALAPAVVSSGRQAMRYLNSLQLERGGRWPSLVGRLNAVAPGAAYDDVVMGATAVFEDVRARTEQRAAVAQ
jgi:heme oxygenase